MDASSKMRLNSYSYDIWGNIASQQETVPQPFKYSGELWDNTTGLQYLRARWYDPSMGRFVNEDTYEGQIDNPLTLNLYTYVESNPLTRWDPTGHATELELMITGLGKIGGPGNAAYWEYRSPLGVIFRDIFQDEDNATFKKLFDEATIEQSQTAIDTLQNAYTDYRNGELYKWVVVQSILETIEATSSGLITTKVSSFSGIQQQLRVAASKADQAVTGIGARAGTLKHSEFKRIVDGFNNSNLRTEVSYLNGKVVPYGTKGAVRLDVVEYASDGITINNVYDLKTGSAALTQSRVKDILNHLPNTAPIHQITP